MDLLENLNSAQKEAVTHGRGPLLIIAGAGTGKTTVLTKRLAWLIAEGLAKPEEILALTFTDKSAGEMEERADRLLPYGYVDLWIQTFHAFGERILREHGLDIGLPNSFRLLSKTEQWLLLRRHWRELKLDYYRPLGNPTKFLDALLTHFSRAADELVSPDDYLNYVKSLQLGSDSAELPAEEAARQAEVAEAYHFYKRKLRETGALDFADLINETLRLFRERPLLLRRYRERFKFIMVDEFQDTNWAQYELVKLLAGEAKNLAVVGDDDQAIYKFRGASVSNILDFQTDFPDCRRVVLTDNYRSRQAILDFAHAFIQHNNPDRLEADSTGGVSKRLAAARGGGGVIRHLHGRTLADEARLTIKKIRELKAEDPETTWSDFAILVRANDHAEPFLTALKIAGVPHEFSSSRGLYQKPLALDVLAWLRLLDNYHESPAVFRILCSPISKIEHEDLVRLTHEAGKKSQSLYETMKNAAAVPGLSAAAQSECARLIALSQKHAELARTKPANAVILAFLGLKQELSENKEKDANDGGYIKALNMKSEDESREEMRVLNYFWRAVEEFNREEVEPTVKNFLARIDYELEAGDTGSLPADPEAGPELVRVMTIHSAKGLEFRHVFIANLVDKRFPTIERRDPIPLPDTLIKEKLPRGDEHLEEERRLFYVAATRAKDSLFLTSADDYGGARKKKLSRFFGESRIDLAEAAGTELTMEVAPATPATKSLLPVPERLSFSQFEAFKKCPLQYKYEHIYRIPKAGNYNKSFGQSVHATFQEFIKRYNERVDAKQADLFGVAENAAAKTLGQAVPVDELLEIYREKWVGDWYQSQDQQKDFFEKGKEALLNYYTKHKDTTLSIRSLEEGFSIKFEGVTVKGRIDRTDTLPDGTVEIIDYKTGKPKEEPLAFKDRLQLLIYQLAAERAIRIKPSRLTFVFLMDGGSEVSFLGTPEELEKAEEDIVKTAAEIRAGYFPPTPEKQTCKRCDFRGICEYAVR